MNGAADPDRLLALTLEFAVSVEDFASVAWSLTDVAAGKEKVDFSSFWLLLGLKTNDPAGREPFVSVLSVLAFDASGLKEVPAKLKVEGGVGGVKSSLGSEDLGCAALLETGAGLALGVEGVVEE